jgi:hypothetical protein
MEGTKPQNVRFSPMPESTSLELIETILISHVDAISNHPELSHIIRTTLMPFLIKSFAEKRAFPVILRITRLMYLIVRNHIDLFPEQCEMVLESFNHVLDQGDGVLAWKRVICMEVWRGIFSDSRLLLQLYSRFDDKETGQPVIRTCMASFVRLASEKPSLIGLGQQSSIPVGNYFQRESGTDGSNDPNSVARAEGTAGVSTAAVPGISQQWSSIRAPCIDQLDKAEPPSLPETYIYSLVLSCLNNLAESLAKFILPLTVHHSGKAKKRRGTVDDGPPSSPSPDSINHEPEASAKLKRTQSYKKRTVPSNPLQLGNHPASQDVQIVAALIEECWPAILASCSTFFYASLDSEYYRALVRSYQKFAQVAGLLRMSTPRDAFLTTLGKAAVPPHVLAASFTSPQTPIRSPSILGSAKELLSVESLVSQASTLLPDRGGRRGSLDTGEPTLSSRNLLCLRALLNLAIALGPTLESSWSIVFETLQQADKVMVASNVRPMSRDSRMGAQSTGQQGGDGGQNQVIISEINAVQAAASRLFDSTADFPNDSFVHVIRSLCRFLEPKQASKEAAILPPPSPGGPHRRISSFSGISVKTDTTDKDFVFALAKLRELVSGNIERFISNPPSESGWDILTSAVTAVATQGDSPSTGRLLAAELLSRMARDTVTTTVEEDEELQNQVQCRTFSSLLMLCKGLGRTADTEYTPTTDETSDEVHAMVLETLRAILEQIGDSLTEGWTAVFDVVLSVFVPLSDRSDNGGADKLPLRSTLCSVSLGRSSFGSVQLICSDFLTCVPDSSLLTLVDTIFRFCSQNQDLNISLTVSLPSTFRKLLLTST